MRLSQHLSPGVSSMLQSTLWFALMNIFAKLVSHLPTGEIVFFRCSVSLVFCFIALKRENIPITGNNHALLWFRGIVGTISLFLYFLTLQNMRLGTAVTIQYLSPLFTIIVAWIALGERVRNIQWFFFAISFAGVFVIKGFDASVSILYLGVGLLSAFLSAVAYTLIRTLKNNEHPMVIVYHFMLVGTLAGIVFSCFDFKMPQGIEWIWLILIGITTQLGQINMTRALQANQVSKISILNYLGVLYAMLAGLVFFEEKYTFISLIGILLIITGVLLDLYSNRKQPN